MKIYSYIDALIDYALHNGLIFEQDRIWARNTLLNLLKLDHYEPGETDTPYTLVEILDGFLEFAVNNKLIENTPTQRDIFDTAVMGAIMPRPSEINATFWKKYKSDKREATDWYYNLSQRSNYIRRDRIDKNEKWKVETEYGPLEITINLSKPEKDPKAIAAARGRKQSGYPRCVLCAENEGYSGRIDHPSRFNHRIIPITLDDEEWSFQYSPFLYYDEHLIALNNKHVPMVINRSAFNKMFDFLDLFPYYFIGSNADLPIVGGSVLTHEHFQGGRHEFAMEKAKLKETIDFKNFPNVEAGILNWPLSVIRLRGESREEVIDLATRILEAWRAYSNEKVGILSQTQGEEHNTITPIARKRGNAYELDLVLRNNRTTKERPHGLFHPREEYHHIKKENIGLIEVMGLAILPERLKEEMQLAAKYLLNKRDLDDTPELKKHAKWLIEIKDKYSGINAQNVDQILKKEIGIVFSKVLEDAGVFKNNSDGELAFKHFIDFVNDELQSSTISNHQ